MTQLITNQQNSFTGRKLVHLNHVLFCFAYNNRQSNFQANTHKELKKYLDFPDIPTNITQQERGERLAPWLIKFVNAHQLN